MKSSKSCGTFGKNIKDTMKFNILESETVQKESRENLFLD